MRFSTVLVLALSMALAAPSARGQAAVELVETTAEIPRDSYKTWSLFLVCNPDWVEPEKSADLLKLYRRFRSFGDAIGRDNLAVWFWKRRMDVNDPRLPENIDIARSTEFCRILRRAPSRGPYLVVTSEYPDPAAFPAERAIFELGGLQPSEIAKLLNTLTDQLVLQGRVDAGLAAEGAGASAAAPPAPSLWIRLLEATRQSLIGLGCAVKLQVDTGLLSAEVRSCTEP